MRNEFTSEGIAGFCQAAAQSVSIEVVDETGSTNADLLARLDRLAGATLLVAREQTAGRGRAGRPWLSGRGKSLTFSLAWPFRLPAHALVGLPLAVGVAIADALAMFDVQVRLKWPNDVLFEDRKLAGILIESASAGTRNWAVVGVGINIALDQETAARIGQPVAGIPWLGQLDQDMLLATLLNALAETLTRFEREGLQAFVTRWNALHAHAGQQVVIMDRGQVLHEGLAAGVDEAGRFLLDTPVGRVAVIAGDVSLRRV